MNATATDPVFRVFAVSAAPMESGPQWAAYHGKTVAQHQTLFDNLTGQGFRPVNISVVELSGTLYITALYDKKNVGGWVATAGLTSAQYQQAFVDNTNAGRRLAYLDGYTEAGSPSFRRFGIRRCTPIGWPGTTRPRRNSKRSSTTGRIRVF